MNPSALGVGTKVGRTVGAGEGTKVGRRDCNGVGVGVGAVLVGVGVSVGKRVGCGVGRWVDDSAATSSRYMPCRGTRPEK